MAKETDVRKLTDRMLAGDVAGCYDLIRHLFEPAPAEAQQVKAEAGLRILPVDETEFSQQDHEDYSAWLDDLYRAEELERLAREQDERRNDM